LSPDDDEALSQLEKSIKVSKPFQFISRKEYSNSQKHAKTILLQEVEEKPVEQTIIQLVTDEFVTFNDESVTKKPGDNSYRAMSLDIKNLTSSSTCSSNKERNNNKRNMHRKRPKKQSKDASKERPIDQQDSYDYSENDNNTSSSPSPSETFSAELSQIIPLDILDISQNLTSKRLKKKIVSGYAITHPKRNRDFHNLFRNIPQNEYLINDYSCALQREILSQGKIFVSLHHVCFHSNIFSWVTNVSTKD
jgi:hypothetical protein